MQTYSLAYLGNSSQYMSNVYHVLLNHDFIKFYANHKTNRPI